MLTLPPPLPLNALFTQQPMGSCENMDHVPLLKDHQWFLFSSHSELEPKSFPWIVDSTRSGAPHLPHGALPWILNGCAQGCSCGLRRFPPHLFQVLTHQRHILPEFLIIPPKIKAPLLLLPCLSLCFIFLHSTYFYLTYQV